MEIKAYQEGNEELILDLFNKSFGKPLSMEYWAWRYQNNPFLNTTKAHLMWENNKLVGHYAVCPVNMLIDGEEIPTALSMTTMTHPDYTGRGIFKELAESLYDELFSKDKIQIIWGFPNLNSHYGFIKNLNWQNVATIPTLKLKNFYFSSFIRSEFIIHEVFTDEMANHLIQCATAGVGVYKSWKYLNWRYCLNPINKYYILSPGNHPEQFVVIKIFQSFEDNSMQEIDILEIALSNSANLFREMIGSIIEFAFTLKLNLLAINTWLNLSDARHILLEKNKFVFDGPTTILGARTFNKETNSDFLCFKKWNISMGDSDVY